mgnify:CR=1 FL=1
MNQKRYDLKPMSIGDVLDYSVEAFRQNFKGIVLLSLILYIPWAVFNSIIVNMFVDNQLAGVFTMYKDILNGTYSPEMANVYLGESSTIGSMITGLMSLIQLAYSLTIKLVLNAAVIKMIYDYAISGEVRIKTFADVKILIKDCFKFMPRMMGNAVLFVLIVGTAYFISALVGAFAIIILVAIIVAMDLPPVLIGIIMVLLMLVIVIAVLCAIAFFAVRLIFGANTIVLEGKSVTDSLKRSFYLSKGKFWHVAFTSVFAFMLYYLFTMLLSVGTILLATVNKTLYIIVNAFSQMCVGISEPFILVFITVLFINMKVQKEGLDLEVKMRTLIEKDVATSND